MELYKHFTTQIYLTSKLNYENQEMSVGDLLTKIDWKDTTQFQEEQFEYPMWKNLPKKLQKHAKKDKDQQE